MKRLLPLLLTLFLTLLLVPACMTTAYESRSSDQPTDPSTPCININKATVDQLKELPGIGEVFASRIVEYRERNNGFRRPQDIIVVEGFSERKYRAIADQICVD